MNQNSIFQALKNLQCFPSPSSKRETDEDNGESVYLNIYNLHWSNEYTQNLGLGIYHSGVELYGKEFGYGGHPYEHSGIFAINPKNVAEMGDDCIYNKTVYLGRTPLSLKSVYKVLDSMSDDFSGDKYHLLKHNCNHFSDEFAKILCKKSIPSWVNRLANLADTLPFVENMLPPEWIKPPTLSDLDEDVPTECNIDQIMQIKAMQNKSRSLSLPSETDSNTPVIISQIEHEPKTTKHSLGPLIHLDDDSPG